MKSAFVTLFLVVISSAGTCMAFSQEHSHFESPLGKRYGSSEMSYIFSDEYLASAYRKIWISLAKVEKELGLPITDEQILEMEIHRDEIDFSAVAAYEQQFRHDLMAHVHAYGDKCPRAKGIIHLGATSCLIKDNAEVAQQKEAIAMINNKLAAVIARLSDFAERYKAVATLAFTHMQPAQPTTVGKRATLWIQDFLLDIEELERLLDGMRYLGIKGATGTQASFLNLFNGDHEKVRLLEQGVAKELGWLKIFPVTGQTYTRKQDSRILSVLAGINASAHKFASDLRLLSHLKEVEEPSGETQIGSSAMPYKRNPMRSERVCGISRYVMNIASNGDNTVATQWFERTLDDSANRRLSLPEAFLATDGVLDLMLDITKGIVVNEKIIASHLNEELPFMVTETILMEAVKRGGDRQQLHERLRVHSLEAAKRVKQKGLKNDLLDRIAQDKAFLIRRREIESLVNPMQLIGRSVEQTESFLEEYVEPVLERYSGRPDYKVSLVSNYY